jgi:hypothetical protein
MRQGDAILGRSSRAELKFIAEALRQGIPAREVACRCLAMRGLDENTAQRELRRKWNAVLQYACYHGLRCPPQNKTGPHNPNWRGGPPPRIFHDGYIKIYVPNHPHADCKGYVFQHRLVMEKRLGRYLKPEEVVHHNDYDKQNNDDSNLTLFASQKAHVYWHIRNDPAFQPKRGAVKDDMPF